MILAIMASYDASVALFMMLQAPLCGRTLERLGSEEQKDQYIPDLIKLNKIWGWALTEEKIGSYASQIESNVRKTKEGYVLNGNKRWIGNGDGDYCVVYAKNLETKKINGNPYTYFRIRRRYESSRCNSSQNREQTGHEISTKLPDLLQKCPTPANIPPPRGHFLSERSLTYPYVKPFLCHVHHIRRLYGNLS